MSRSISINAFKQTEIQRDCIIQRQILWAWNDGEYAAPFVSTVFAGFLPIFPNKLNASLRSFAKISDCHAVARGLACVPFPQSLVCCWRYVVSASKAFWWSRLHLFITPATIFVICRHASCSHHVLIMFSSAFSLYLWKDWLDWDEDWGRFIRLYTHRASSLQEQRPDPESRDYLVLVDLSWS